MVYNLCELVRPSVVNSGYKLIGALWQTRNPFEVRRLAAALLPVEGQGWGIPSPDDRFTAGLTHLESIPTGTPASVDSKPLTETISPLDATFTKNIGEGTSPVWLLSCWPPRLLPPAFPTIPFVFKSLRTLSIVTRVYGAPTLQNSPYAESVFKVCV